MIKQYNKNVNFPSYFNNFQELSVPVSEEFVEFLSEGAVAIEVYGHKQANHRRNLALWDLGVIQAKTRSLRERYSDTNMQTDSKRHTLFPTASIKQEKRLVNR